MASALERAARAWQASIAARDDAQRRVILARWRAVEGDIGRRIAAIERRLLAAHTAGRTPGVTLMYERGRLHDLRAQVERAMTDWGHVVTRRVSDDRDAAARDAIQWSERLIREHVGSKTGLASLRPDVVEAAIAHQAPGGPLAMLMGELGPQAAHAIADGLVTGVATGQNPAVVARRIRDSILPTYRGRALTIARTEMMRSVREATRQRYQASRDILEGWMWWSSTDRTTCAACWAMHGTVHGLDETMDGHPGCRCVMTPVVSGSTLNYGPSGEDAFAVLPADVQRAIIGPAATTGM